MSETPHPHTMDDFSPCTPRDCPLLHRAAWEVESSLVLLRDMLPRMPDNFLRAEAEYRIERLQDCLELLQSGMPGCY